MQCTFINGSPQNALVPGVMELAEQRGVFVGGDDFKTGQTKLKSVLVDFLVSAGLKPTSIVSYNHLGNNDGKNLSAPKQFRSKEVGNCMCSITHIPKIEFYGPRTHSQAYTHAHIHMRAHTCKHTHTQPPLSTLALF